MVAGFRIVAQNVASLTSSQYANLINVDNQLHKTLQLHVETLGLYEHKTITMVADTKM